MTHSYVDSSNASASLIDIWLGRALFLQVVLVELFEDLQLSVCLVMF